MMVARLSNPSGTKDALLVILEPGNIGKLEAGQPIMKNLKAFLPELPEPVELLIAYTPDIVFVAEKVTGGMDIAMALEASMARPEVFRRPDQAEQIIVAKEVKGQR